MCGLRHADRGNEQFQPGKHKDRQPGCGCSAAYAKSRVNGLPELSSTCTAGWAWDSAAGGYNFAPFPGPTSFPSGVQFSGGYQIKLTNTSNVTAEVGGFSVVFYDAGTELGSDSEDVSEEFITPGQSLTWTEETSLMNAGIEGAVGTSDTCALVQWYQ